MAYYLTIKRNNDYKLVDLSSLEEFTKLSKYKNGVFSLDEIDECTSKFCDEISLKKSLYENGLIEIGDITKELSIRMKNKEKLEKVRYGLVYSNMKKYLDINYLRSAILVLQNDREFLEKLVSNYRNSYSNAVTVAEITNYLFDNCNFRINIYNALNDFFINEIFSREKEAGEVKLKYKSLHDLAMFVYNYISNIEKRMKNQSENLDNISKSKQLLQLQKDLIIKDNKNNGNYPIKKLTKKELEKTPIEGQISLF